MRLTFIFSKAAWKYSAIKNNNKKKSKEDENDN